MLNMARRDGRKFAYRLLAASLLLAIGAAGNARAQVRVPQQGFEATGQDPAHYTPEEAAAVRVVQKWLETTNNHDLAGHMALIDDNVVFRADPEEPLSRGARGYCAAFGFVRGTGTLRIDELYVVGGPSDTLVLIKRADINAPASGGRQGSLAGYPVPLSVLLRVKSGKITEWYDAPLNKVSMAALPAGALPAFVRDPSWRPKIPDACMKYPDGGK